jgi:N-acetylglucosaminyldiphosphoundecaprenol N-acetyl-beta-D-mannosaminyltransferase
LNPKKSNPEQTRVPTVSVLGYRVARVTREEAVRWSLAATRQGEPKLLVTLNPEIIVRAERDGALRSALEHADLTVADGVGITWAARHTGQPLPERVPGVELMTEILRQGGSDLRVYFLGAKPGVAERAARAAQERFGTVVAGVQHGYFKRPEDVSGVAARIAASGAQLLLAGLGEGQELFLHTHRTALGVPLMIGVGGALDVLAGEVKRTPPWTHRLGLEWAYRVGSDPKRWHRFPRLLRFVRLVWQRG